MSKRREEYVDVHGVIDAVEEAAKKALAKCAVTVESAAKQSMKSGGGALHEPSSPPTAPNVQTGILRASITYAIDRTRRGFVALVGVPVTAFYGKIHEYGGSFNVKQHMRRKSRGDSAMISVSAHTREVPERPFMRPALVKSVRDFPKMFKDMNLAQTASGRKLNSRKGEK